MNMEKQVEEHSYEGMTNNLKMPHAWEKKTSDQPLVLPICTPLMARAEASRGTSIP